jgi:hypothetical protein
MRLRRFFVYPKLVRLYVKREVCAEFSELLRRADQAAEDGSWEEMHEAILRLVVFPFLVLSGLSGGSALGHANYSIQRRVAAWRRGDFEDLLEEAKQKF